MKTHSKEYSIPRAGIAILNYLRDHPNAQDSASGIAEWWVGEPLTVVERALDVLVREGTVEQIGALYRAKKKVFPENERLKNSESLRNME